VQEATGKKVEIVTTTDYNITVENIVSVQSQIAYIGAEAYLNARQRTKDIEAVLTNAGESGTLEDARYYSFIAVRGEDANKYLPAQAAIGRINFVGRKARNLRRRFEYSNHGCSILLSYDFSCGSPQPSSAHSIKSVWNARK